MTNDNRGDVCWDVLDELKKYGGPSTNKRAADEIKRLRAEIKRLRALLVRYQVANYIPEDCDLYAETKAVLERGLGPKS